MSRPADLITFAEDWGRWPTSSQHLIRCLAADRRVLYVNSLGLRRPRLNASDAGRAAQKVLAAIRLGKTAKPKDGGNQQDSRATTPPNLDVYSPMAVSWPSSKLAFNFNRKVLGRQLRHELAVRKFDRPILWTSLPSALPVIGTLNERAMVYYCCDDFGSLVGVDHEPIMAMERKIVERADIIFATSDVLADRMPNARTILIPHGTDWDHFAAPQPRALDLPTADKIAGFYGSIDDRLNLKMLVESAERLPDWEFVLIGSVTTDTSILNGHRNIHLLGPRPYSALPSYVQHWQVSMILYTFDEQVRAGNPLKLREYLAAGTPIATIEVPALKDYLGLLSICKSPSGYASAILEAAADTARNEDRRTSVRYESWQARATVISEALADL